MGGSKRQTDNMTVNKLSQNPITTEYFIYNSAIMKRADIKITFTYKNTLTFLFSQEYFYNN